MTEETDLFIHDPSAIQKRGDTYWVFGTGRGINIASSPNRVNWTRQGSVLAETPAWAKEAVPGNINNFLWAPDVQYVSGRYYLYYSISTFGSNTSAIGLATSATLLPGSWTDRGMVVRSGAGSPFNAIDAGAVRTKEGGLWLAFGSFWRGIYLVELNPATGLRKNPDDTPLRIAAHTERRPNAIEAPYIHYRDGWYYLFVNWDVCCKGAKSSYNIRVGRSKTVNGTYVDKAGVAMADGGGTVFLTSKHDDESGKPFDAKVGPGHAGIFTENGVDRFSFHYEYVREKNGRSVMEIRTLHWRDGWPELA